MKIFSACLLLLLFVGSLALVSMHRGDASTQDRDAILAPASWQHWAGTDDLGRDRATRIASALLLGTVGAITVASITTAAALVVAILVAFAPAGIGQVLLYATEMCLALPWLFVLMLVRSILPLNQSASAGALATFGLLALLGWPMHVRSLSARLDAVRGAEWLQAAHAAGIHKARVAFRYVLPHLRPLYLTQFLLCVPACIFAEADLGAIGFGMGEPLVSWGTLLQEAGSSAQMAATHWVYLPLALLLTLLLCVESLLVED